MKESTTLLAAFLILLIGFFSVDTSLSGQPVYDEPQRSDPGRINAETYLRAHPSEANARISESQMADLGAPLGEGCVAVIDGIFGNNDGRVSELELKHAGSFAAGARGSVDYDPDTSIANANVVEQCIKGFRAARGITCTSSQEGRTVVNNGIIFVCENRVAVPVDDCTDLNEEVRYDANGNPVCSKGTAGAEHYG